MQSQRLQLYKKNRLAGMNRYNAARAAGYSHSYAMGKGRKLEAQVEKDLRNEFQRQGLTDKAIVGFALTGMQATKMQSCDVYIKTEDGKLVPNENSNDFIEVPDWNARHKFFDTVMQLSGLLKSGGIDQSVKIQGGETKIVIVYPNDYKAKADRLANTSQDISG